MEQGTVVEEKLQFVPFSSCVDPSFWHKVAQLKLDVDKLEEPVRKIWGYHSNVLPRGLNTILSVDCSSFNESADEGSVVSVGKLINKNTLDSFKDIDKAKLLAEEGEELLEILKNSALDNPQLLSRFLIICFADLKQHKFTYWFAFPAINAVAPKLSKPVQSAKQVFSTQELDEIVTVIDRKKNYFILESTKGVVTVHDVRVGFEEIKKGLLEQFFLVFADSCEDNCYPGWPLRNYLALFAYHCPEYLTFPVKVICLRYKVTGGKWSLGESPVMEVILGNDINWKKSEIVVGWERNDKSRFGPRLANLNSSMNPLALAESSVDLNLKLMKWQVVPDIDLDVIKDTKCLLLGAGTLGCAVARSLLGWGVRNITFVDSANVSYSNPVRQNLYQFSDVGKSKASAAAAALKAIFPSVISAGEVLSIPMPGHPVGASLLDEVTKTIARLDALINDHDVIFLLMDSRESRWLPTVVGAVHQKMVINAALGFDSYLVIRHGVRTSDPSGQLTSRLGCYFCSDVTAPGNSGQARTLDQQCTVTRPGVSSIAGSIAVELMVSLLQHEMKALAPAFNTTGGATECILGKIPHSIRGFLSRYETILPAIESFKCCVGCSDKVVEGYQSGGCEFVLKVLESKKYLEELTGLTLLQNESILDDVMVLSDEDDSS